MPGFPNNDLINVQGRQAGPGFERQVGDINPFLDPGAPEENEIGSHQEGKFSRMTEKTNPLISKLFTYTLLVYILIILMTHLGRDIFLDLIAGLLLLSAWYFDIPKLLKQFIYKSIGAIVLAIVFDIIWLVLYHKPYWKTGYQDSFSLWRFRRYLVVMSYILMFVRVLMMVLLILLLGEIKKGEGQSEFVNQPEYSDINSHPDNKGYDANNPAGTNFDPFNSRDASYPRVV